MTSPSLDSTRTITRLSSSRSRPKAASRWKSKKRTDSGAPRRGPSGVELAGDALGGRGERSKRPVRLRLIPVGGGEEIVRSMVRMPVLDRDLDVLLEGDGCFRV